MTKDEILALPLDELNELVAEKVMGEPKHQRGAWPGLFDYTDDISAAWRVQEKMAEKGYTMSLLHRRTCAQEVILGFPKGSTWYCDFRLYDDRFPPETTWVDIQPSAPEAICRAALLAVSGEGDLAHSLP